GWAGPGRADALAAGAAVSPTAGPPHVQVVLSGDVQVRRGEVSRDVVVIHGSVDVEGTVWGSVVVFDGPVRISGLVKGDVVALGGTVTLLRGAHVTGDVWVGRGQPVVQVGSAIDGRLHTGGIIRFAAPSSVVARF